MKSKKLTYFLGVLVIVVWGLILYKLFLAVSGDEGPVINNILTPAKESLNDYTIVKDTTRLSLNYRDPFTDKKPEPVEIPVSQLVHKTPVQKPAINWTMIRYVGFIHNPGSKKIIAMVNINGKEIMMTEGETAEQVKLIKNLKDSIKVSYQGAFKFITLNNKTL